MRRFIIKFLWSTLIGGILISALAFTAIWNGWIGYMPALTSLQNPINRFASQIYSADGKVIGTWNLNKENRICIPYEDLSPHIVHALVATEDMRFYDHSGIDFIALARAIVKRGILGYESAGGGSTITQQLAKQLYSQKAHSTIERLFQKPIEWVIAVKIERYYTKEEILALYLNYFDFLHNAVGIKTAADTYFAKEPKNLTVNESAMLVGLCKNPSYFNPVRHPERAKERRNVVLHQMLNSGYLLKAEYEKLKLEDIKLKFKRSGHKDGMAPYFREHLRIYMSAAEPKLSDYPAWNKGQYYADSIAWANDPLYGWCNKNHKKDGTPYNIYTDGLKIYTTLDTRMQKYAEDAVYKHIAKFLQKKFWIENAKRVNAPYSENLTPSQIRDILNRSIRQSERYISMKKAGISEERIMKSFRKPVEMTVFSYKGEIDTVMTPLDSIKYYKSFLRVGFMSMEPLTGHVKAYVGGTDFSHFQYDMVWDGRRQVGSTIKPFLYALAMENGFTPCDQVLNVQSTYMVAGKPWTPRNATRRRVGQMVSLRWALANSNNWVSAYLMSKLNPRQFVSLLRDFGIKSPNLHPSMALCLGPCEITLAEMVSAFSTFPNRGIRTSPLLVTRIESNDGNVIARFQPRMNEVISENSANKLLVLLQAVVDEGTAGRVRYRYGIESQVGAKTGTTNANSDGWFIGFTPELVSGCWVGGEDRDIHFDNMTMGQGASMALPVWCIYMNKIYADKTLGYRSDAKFEIPEDFSPCDKFGDYESGIRTEHVAPHDSVGNHDESEEEEIIE